MHALHAWTSASFICEVCVQHAHNDAQSRLTSGEYTALRRNRQVVYEWQSRIKMERSVDELSLKNVQLGFVYILH